MVRRSRAASSAIRVASAAMVGKCNSRQATRMAASAAGSVIGFTCPPPPVQPPGRPPHGRGVAASGCGRWRAGRHSCPVPVWAGRSGPGFVSPCRSGRPVAVSVSAAWRASTRTTSGLTLPAWSARRIPSMTATAGRCRWPSSTSINARVPGASPSLRRAARQNASWLEGTRPAHGLGPARLGSEARQACGPAPLESGQAPATGRLAQPRVRGRRRLARRADLNKGRAQAHVHCPPGKPRRQRVVTLPHPDPGLVVDPGGQHPSGIERLCW
jgi:hypothetical protein